MEITAQFCGVNFFHLYMGAQERAGLSDFTYETPYSYSSYDSLFL